MQRTTKFGVTPSKPPALDPRPKVGTRVRIKQRIVLPGKSFSIEPGTLAQVVSHVEDRFINLRFFKGELRDAYPAGLLLYAHQVESSDASTSGEVRQ